MIKKWFKRKTRVVVDDVGSVVITRPLQVREEVHSMSIQYRRVTVMGRNVWSWLLGGGGTVYRCTITLNHDKREYHYQVRTSDRDEMIREVVGRVGETITTDAVVKQLMKVA